MAACAVALATAGLASAGPTRAAAAAGYVPHRCYVSELAVGFHGGQAGLGNRGFLVTLTDVSGASCRGRLPGARAAGRVLAAAVHQDAAGADLQPPPGPGRKLIVLSPGETASADISFGVAGQRSNSVLATYLQVTPPGSHRQVVLRIPSGAALVFRGELDVTALARHTPYFP